MMMIRNKTLMLFASVAGSLGLAVSASAQTTVIQSPPKTPSTYRIIAPESGKHHTKVYATQPAILQQKAAAPYSYGWFGAGSTGQWSRQFGSSRSYIQWNRK
ncbi:MAG: hypothetical protein MUC43_01410 [Pirellula sp.]|jgi:hypothetical protein|nr:hypothetical protein [Pirellula sp.]